MSVFLSRRGGVFERESGVSTGVFYHITCRDPEHTEHSVVSEVVLRCDKVSDSPVSGGV